MSARHQRQEQKDVNVVRNPRMSRPSWMDVDDDDENDEVIADIAADQMEEDVDDDPPESGSASGQETVNFDADGVIKSPIIDDATVSLFWVTYCGDQYTFSGTYSSSPTAWKDTKFKDFIKASADLDRYESLLGALKTPDNVPLLGNMWVKAGNYKLPEHPTTLVPIISAYLYLYVVGMYLIGYCRMNGPFNGVRDVPITLVDAQTMVRIRKLIWNFITDGRNNAIFQNTCNACIKQFEDEVEALGSSVEALGSSVSEDTRLPEHDSESMPYTSQVVERVEPTNAAQVLNILQKPKYGISYETARVIQNVWSDTRSIGRLRSLLYEVELTCLFVQLPREMEDNAADDESNLLVVRKHMGELSENIGKLMATRMVLQKVLTIME